MRARRHPLCRLIAVLAVAGGAATTAPAHAATAGTSAAGGGVVDYAAARSEANQLTASLSGATITLSDAGATIAPRAGCTAVDAHTVRCAGSAVSTALGDGDDTATVTGALPAHLDGGAGADRLTGGSGSDTLDGGAGADVLSGGAGDDRLSGDGPALVVAGGDDRLVGGPGADAMTGDGGRDTVDYSAAPGAAATFDGRPDDGVPGEGDNADAEVVLAAGTGPATPPPAPVTSPAPPPAPSPPPPPAAVPLGAPPLARLPAATPVPPAAAAPVCGVRVAARVTAATLRRRGVRVAVTCTPACRVRLALTPATASRPVYVTRSVAAGPGTTTVALRPRAAARLPRGRRLAVRARFATGGAAIARRIAVR
jgi:RTX calcium-binding nonapeptide repeat (4 copies)